MNARNTLIATVNPIAAIRAVNRKYHTKLTLATAGIPVAPTLGVAHDVPSLHSIVARLPDAWAMKPDRGRAGRGILIASRRQNQAWITPGGRRLAVDDVMDHGRQLLVGDQSMGDWHEDLVLTEPLLVAHPSLAELASAGLPDVRVVVYRRRVLAAMLRLPTIAGDGRANLHQGGVGVAIDLSTGRTVAAMQHGRPIDRHPDTSRPLQLLVPYWDQIHDVSRRCGDALGLGYYGADVVIDASLGPIIIEVNARPGLEIQNVCDSPLREAL